VNQLDLAVIGAGAAGTAIADGALRAKPDWSIGLFERSARIGGRLHSVEVPGLDHPIELGGMRILTSHPLVAGVVADLGLPTHRFVPSTLPERTFFRGVFGGGSDDPAAGTGYELDAAERGRSASDLAGMAFDRFLPGAGGMDHAAFADARLTRRFRDRRLIDWSFDEAIAATLSPAGDRFVADAFGYDAIRFMNAGDTAEFLFAGGDPTEQARTPDGGMDRIPRGLAARFAEGGGEIALDHELVALEPDDGEIRLRFANDRTAQARRVVLAVPIPALRQLGRGAPALQGAAFQRAIGSVESIPAMYTDMRHVEPWIPLFEGGAAGAPAPASMLAEVQRQLAELHPGMSVPPPAGSALQYWGADAHETGWHFWRPGIVSDEILELAPRPDPALPIYLAGEQFSRRQSWVEGALESAEAVLRALDERRGARFGS
jgi:monoamine oxidase